MIRQLGRPARPGPAPAVGRPAAARRSAAELLDWGRDDVRRRRSTSSTARPSATSSSPTATGSCRSGPARWAAPCPATRSRSSTTTASPVAAGVVGRDRRRAARPGHVPRLLEPARGDARQVQRRLAADRRPGEHGRRRLLWYQARNDDVITSGGYRIGPGEIEDCLLRHPAVAMAAVVGIPDPIRTEIVKAFVVLAPGTVPSPALTGRAPGVRPRAAGGRTSTRARSSTSPSCR